jgi:2-polyprenyl-3-methyl-5-hydroxy-6-metoxy-1,4-benzoquinol methylase
MNPVPESAVNCPVCDSDKTRFVLQVKDHSISGEYFSIFECPVCSLRFTHPIPPGELIGKYYKSENYISHSNIRKGLVNNLYHLVRNRTLVSKYHLLKKLTGQGKGKHLDIGAGTGAFVQYLNQRGWSSEGIEPDATARAVALEHHQTKLLSGEAFESLLPAQYDAITLWHVLEHVHGLYPYLHRIRDLLKPTGVVCIAVPNYSSYDAVKYGADWAAYDVPRHLYHFSPASMLWLLKASGFQWKEMVPMWYDSFYISLLSEKYRGGSRSLIKGFYTGAVSNLKALGNKEKCSSLIYVAGAAK